MVLKLSQKGVSAFVWLAAVQELDSASIGSVIPIISTLLQAFVGDVTTSVCIYIPKTVICVMVTEAQQMELVHPVMDRSSYQIRLIVIIVMLMVVISLFRYLMMQTAETMLLLRWRLAEMLS